MTRNMAPPDNLVDQIHYDIAHGRVEGPEIRLTQEQMDSAPETGLGPLQDGMMFLGKTIRLTTGEPDVVYPPKIPNEDWVIRGIRWG